MTTAIVYHQLANSMPPMSETEYTRLVDDIRKNGLKVPIVMYENRLLDGRNRLRACVELGIAPATISFVGTEEEAEAHMLSLNVHRRHLTAEQRRKIVAAELKVNQMQTDRAIAAKAGVDHKTVATIRDEALVNGEIPHNTERTESTGKAARGRKPAMRPGSKPFAERVEEIKPLASRGLSVSQIAAKVGISTAKVSEIIRKASIPIPSRAAMGKARILNPERVIEECVNTLVAVARGLDRIKQAQFKLEPAAAMELFDEVMDSRRSIDWLSKKLREIGNA